MVRIQYSLRNTDGRLVHCVERDFVELLLTHIKPRGIGFWKTEAQVEQAIREGVEAAFDVMRKDG